ncbi:putative secreted protein [Leifsonia rubra CMS 76R]|nr:putative secreted protein [Leifsonia rubra CMS 76R]
MSTPTVITPRIRTTLKRALFWIIAAAFLLSVALVSLTTVGTAVEGPPLDPTSPRESGTLALAEVLRDQGVEVTVTASLNDTREAIAETGESTLFFSNFEGYLTDSQVEEAAGLARTVVLADPDLAALLAVAPEVAQAGASSGTVTTACAPPLVPTAAEITAGPSNLRVIDTDADATACYGNDDDGFGLVSLNRGTTELLLIGATDALTNGDIALADNAAFALQLLGQHDSLIWYTPSFVDVSGSGEGQTFDELAPDWVLPAVWLTILTLLTAALWRGRRFGPLVIEKLPVTVRSSETMQGRARLYEKTAARLHTLDALRIGSLRRLAAVCGMASTASVDDVINRIGPLITQPVAQLRTLLVDASPTSDGELLALSDELLSLEQRVERAIRPT